MIGIFFAIQCRFFKHCLTLVVLGKKISRGIIIDNWTLLKHGKYKISQLESKWAWLNFLKGLNECVSKQAWNLKECTFQVSNKDHLSWLCYCIKQMLAIRISMQATNDDNNNDMIPSTKIELLGIFSYNKFACTCKRS